jgi:glutamate---cysteine ligase / carboxylate-amine ligase
VDTRIELRTVGVEEELLLFEAGTTDLSRVGGDLADPPEDQSRGESQAHLTIDHEFKRAQIETASLPRAQMADLRRDIEAGRREVARRAAGRNAVVAALATDPAPSVPVTTREARYEQMANLYGAVADSQLACGFHVHVSVVSDDEGVQVIDRLRPWLPTLLAMSANSPYHQGRDTGYASWRSVMWGLWPTSGPTGIFGTPQVYRRRVEEQISTGAAIDEAMIYFDARLSASYPTVEIRVMDVVPRPSLAVTLAALCRALVETAAGEARHGLEAIPVSRSLLRAMNWRAARFGLSGELVLPDGSALAPAAEVIGELIAHVQSALERSGDLQLVEHGVRRLLRDGGGASMQRDAFSARGSVADVVATAVRWTSDRELS